MTGLADLRAVDLENLAKRYELACITFAKGVNLDDADKQIELIVAAGAKLASALTPMAAAPQLSSVERSVSFTNAIERLAENLKGGVVLGDEAFLEAVIRFADEKHQNFWSMQPAGLLRSLLGSEPAIISFLALKGLVVWIGDDERTRVVNAFWLREYQDIHRFVAGEAPVGRTCRFCATIEADDRQQLIEYDDREDVAGELLRTNMAGQRRSVLATGRVSLHSQCAEHWARWLEIARAYHRDHPGDTK